MFLSNLVSSDPSHIVLNVLSGSQLLWLVIPLGFK